MLFVKLSTALALGFTAFTAAAPAVVPRMLQDDDVPFDAVSSAPAATETPAGWEKWQSPPFNPHDKRDEAGNPPGGYPFKPTRVVESKRDEAGNPPGGYPFKPARAVGSKPDEAGVPAGGSSYMPPRDVESKRDQAGNPPGGWPHPGYPHGPKPNGTEGIPPWKGHEKRVDAAGNPPGGWPQPGRPYHPNANGTHIPPWKSHEKRVPPPDVIDEHNLPFRPNGTHGIPPWKSHEKRVPPPEKLDELDVDFKPTPTEAKRTVPPPGSPHRPNDTWVPPPGHVKPGQPIFTTPVEEDLPLEK